MEGTFQIAALEYIAKLADGGLRDAITMLDKALNYSPELTVDNVVAALGAQSYETFFSLTDMLVEQNPEKAITVIEEIYLSGKDLKQFIKQYVVFLLDMCKYRLLKNFDYIQIPNTYETKLKNYSDNEYHFINDLRNRMIKLNSEIKWENAPKVFIEAEMLNICYGDEE